MPKIGTVRAGLLEVRLLLLDSMDAYTKRQAVLTLFLVVTGAVVGTLTPFVYKLLIDALTVDTVNGGIHRGLVLLVVTYVVSQFLEKGFISWRACTYELGSQRLKRLLSRRVFAHLVRLPVQFHLEQQIGSIVETLNQGLGGVQTLLQHMQVTLLPIALEFVGIIGVLIYVGHPAYLAILGPASLIYAVAFSRSVSSITQPARTAVQMHAVAQGLFGDALLNFETLKAFGAEARMVEHYDRALAGREASARQLLRVRTTNSLTIAGIFAVSIGMVVSLSVYQVVSHTMTVGDFVLMLSYAMRLMLPLEVIGVAIRDSAQALAFLHRMLQILRVRPESDAEVPGRAKRAGVSKGNIRFENVSFSYADGRAVLKNVTFQIAAGNTIGIVGVSGSGKSSLVRLLFRFYQPTAGRILLDGAPISEIGLADLRRCIAFIPQDVVLFNDTIGRNIALGKPEASLEEIRAAAKLAHLDQYVSSLPEGYASIVGTRGLKLSGGERQRLAIARAAIIRPRIYVCDEATSSLDSATEREVMSNLIDVTRSTTTFIIAHRLSTIVHVDQILVLDNGSVIERGTHTSLMSADGCYAALWRTQHAGVSPALPAIDGSHPQPFSRAADRGGYIPPR
jgi:ABC-type transport system involved in Fe-S cluster assembly fused permease/ATPase subunit